jgi:hypothetical protein
MISANRYTSGWESGCGPADPAISNISTVIYSVPGTTGYGTVGHGTINTAPIGSQTAPPGPAQAGMPQAALRVYRGADGNIYAVDPSTGITYLI